MRYKLIHKWKFSGHFVTGIVETKLDWPTNKTVAYPDKYHATAKENALLLAAAPSLLQGCEAALEYLKSNLDDFDNDAVRVLEEVIHYAYTGEIKDEK